MSYFEFFQVVGKHAKKNGLQFEAVVIVFFLNCLHASELIIHHRMPCVLMNKYNTYKYLYIYDVDVSAETTKHRPGLGGCSKR